MKKHFLLFVASLLFISCSNELEINDTTIENDTIIKQDQYYVKYTIEATTTISYTTHEITATYTTPKGTFSTNEVGEYVAGPFAYGNTVWLRVSQEEWNQNLTSYHPYGKISISINGMPFVDVIEKRQNGGFSISYTIR